MRYQAVIFDLFGTIVDYFTLPVYKQVLEEMAAVLSVSPEELGRQWWESFSRRVTGDFKDVESNLKHICQKLGVTPSEEAMAEAVRIRIGFTRQAMEPRQDAVSTLTSMKDMRLKLGLISDCSAEVPIIWPETPFAALVDVPVFSATEGLRKPDPEIYHRACQRLGVSPEGCLYVGDGSSDELAGAARVGMTPVLIRVPYEDEYEEHRLHSSKWDGLKVTSLPELLPMVAAEPSPSA